MSDTPVGRPHLLARALTALHANPFLAGRNLRIEPREGGIALRGVVRSYYHKQIATHAVRQVAGVGRIENELEVSGRLPDWR